MDLHRARVTLASVQRGEFHAGWLHEPSGSITRSWRRRYCVLKGSLLHQFRSDKPDEVSTATVNLNDFAAVSNYASRKSEYCFMLEPMSGSGLAKTAGKSSFLFQGPRQHANKGPCFYAANEHEFTEWTQKLQAKIVRISDANVVDAALSRLDYGRYSTRPRARTETNPVTPPHSKPQTPQTPYSPQSMKLRTQISFESADGQSDVLSAGSRSSWDDRTLTNASSLVSTSSLPTMMRQKTERRPVLILPSDAARSTTPHSLSRRRSSPFLRKSYVDTVSKRSGKHLKCGSSMRSFKPDEDQDDDDNDDDDDDRSGMSTPTFGSLSVTASYSGMSNVPTPDLNLDILHDRLVISEVSSTNPDTTATSL